MAEEDLKKLKKKKWHLIMAPSLFGDKILGESYVYEPSKLVGKILEVNLMTVIGDPKKQNINAKFRVTKIQDGKGLTDLESFSLLPSSIKRVVRRGRDKITDSFLCITADKKIVRVKPLVITNSKTHNSAKKEIRKITKDTFICEIYNLKLEDVFRSIINQDIYRTIKAFASKIHPVRNVDTIFIGIETEKKYTRSQEKLEKEAEARDVKEYFAKKEKARAEKRAQKRQSDEKEKADVVEQNNEKEETEELPKAQKEQSEKEQSEKDKTEKKPNEEEDSKAKNQQS